MSCAQDKSFGPGSTCRDLDFSLYFEQTILSFGPDIVFIVLAIFRLTYLRAQPQRTKRSLWSRFLLLVKLLSVLFVVATTIASLAMSHRRPIYSASVGLAAPALQVVAAAFLIPLVALEHTQTITPSTLVITYAFIKGLFSAAILRTALTIDSNTTVILLGLVMGSYFLLTFTEILGKGRGTLEKDVAQVSATSFVSRSLYHWILPLMWTGRKKKLTIAECGDIPPEMAADASTEPLRKVLTGTPRVGKHYLMSASFKAFPLLFLSPIIPRVILMLASFAQPLLILRMIEFISDPSQSSERGWALVGGFVSTYALIFLMTSVYWDKVFNSTVLYRGALVGNIYSKTLRLSSAAGKEVGGGVASTYMSVDVERVCLGLETAHEMWAAIVSIILAIALLWSQATWPALLPLAITFILVTISGRISKGVGAAQKQWLGSTDKRVKFLTSVFHNFLPAKLSHYEDVLAARAATLRAHEMQGARSFYNNISITGAFTSSSWAACTLSVLGPYAGLAAHGHGHGSLDPGRLFTIVAIVNLVAPPLTLLGTGLPQLLAAMASFRRIEKYLMMEERVPAGRSPSAKEGAELDEKKSGMAADIVLTEASFSWAADKPAFLGPLSVSLKSTRLNVCVGPVASGKTFFLLSVLGESVKTGGSIIQPTTHVAYAAQDPLIVPGTLRENILFGKEYTEDWYNTVIEACALRPDLARLPGADGVYLGEKGSSLSGGQRQRVSLARAIYARAPWTFLDDPFSSLDAETEQHIFQALFGTSGLLEGKAVVLVTNNVRHLNAAEHVLVFDTGALKHNGTLDEVMRTGYQFTRADVPAAAIKSDAPTKAAAGGAKPHVAQKEPPEKPIAQASLGWTPYKFYMSMAGWSGSFIVIFLIGCTGLGGLALRIYQEQWANSGGRHVGAWIGGYAGLVVLYLLLVGFGMWGYTLVISNALGHNMHATELRGILGTTPTFMTTTTPGRIVNRFSQDVFMSDLEVPWNVVNVIMQSVLVVGFVVFMCIPDPWLTIAVPFLGALYYIMLSFYLKTAKQFQALGAASKSPLYTQFSTTISGLATIRALGVEAYFQKQNDTILDQSQVPFFYRFASVRLLRSFLAMLAFFMALGLSVLAVGLRHSTSPAALGLALSSLTSMASQLNTLLMNLTGLENASVALSRIHEIATLPAEEDPAAGKKTPEGTFGLGNIEFKNVSVRYGADLPLVVNNVSFKVSAGKKIGICGRSGSGKSSLLMALFRGVESSLLSGTVLLDDLDTQTVSLGSLRDSLSLVSQTPFIWHAPLRHNLDPHGQLSDKDIWLTLERIGMSTAVGELPNKLETVLDGEGSLSSGQRQLLCLARVLLKGGNVVVLDEASSSLDGETDKKIREVIHTDLKHSTVVAVAHRIETIIDFDLILVMEDGALVESGPPASLMSQPGSKFAQLAASQGILL
ncbi:P-loop containing nucleoside triphosphate hydrolase protein [Mycena amicta]|nr:P-loop containing nucleoside triphosphate hydrolase protein [Mycena amicta]